MPHVYTIRASHYFERVIRITNGSLFSMPLAFYTISFGTERRSDSLRKMANVAREVYATARNSGRDISGNPCSYVNAIDSVSG